MDSDEDVPQPMVDDGSLKGRPTIDERVVETEKKVSELDNRVGALEESPPEPAPKMKEPQGDWSEYM